MGAVKNKRPLQSSHQFLNRYGGVPVVYVESEEDCYVYGTCWFREDSARVEFQAVANRSSNKGFSGCKAVIQAVQEDAAAGNPSWGMVDRDAVMTHDHWHLVNETNDERFDATQPFGPRVKVLRLWELENYLVDAPAMENYRAQKDLSPTRPMSTVWAELWTDCDALLPHAALNAVYHHYKISGLGDGSTDNHKSRAEVETQLVDKVLSGLKEKKQKSDCAEVYTTHLEQVDAFDDKNAPPELRVRGVLRRVHGKALLSRFKTRHKIKDDCRGILAAQIKATNRVPQELRAFVSQVVQEG